MKTFAHIDTANNIVGIGMIYYESGGFSNGVLNFFDRILSFSEYSNSTIDELIVMYGESIAHIRVKQTKLIDTIDMPGDDPDRYDKTFRSAFKKGTNFSVDIDLLKAQLIAHDFRRKKRAADFAPLDTKATIPAELAQAEADRQIIRTKDAQLQIDIDNAFDDVTLKQLMIDNGLLK